MSMVDPDFDEKLDRYQARRANDALDAEERSWEVARRPTAERSKVPFGELRPGDYMTSDGIRWVEVIEVRPGPSQHARADEVSVLFETPEAVIPSGETRFWIERPAIAEVTIDQNARRA